MAEGLQETRTQDPLPGPLFVLRFLGFAALLAFPVVTTIVFKFAHIPYPASFWVVMSTSGMVVLAFILTGAGFRVAGGVLRGALAGAVLYILIGVAFSAYVALRFPAFFELDFNNPSYVLFMTVYYGAEWPLYGFFWLLQSFGVTRL